MLKGLVGLVLPGGAILVWALFSRGGPIVPKLFSPGPARPLPGPRPALAPHDRAAGRGVVRLLRRRRALPALLRERAPAERAAASLRPRPPRRARPLDAVPRAARRARSPRSAGGSGGSGEPRPFSRSTGSSSSSSSPLSRSKLVPYILPVWPAVAVLLALGLEKARQRGAPLRPERYAAGLLFGLLAGGVAA